MGRLLVFLTARNERRNVIPAREDFDQIGQQGFNSVRNIHAHRFGAVRQGRNVGHFALGVVQREFALFDQLRRVVEPDSPLSLVSDQIQQIGVVHSSGVQNLAGMTACASASSANFRKYVVPP